MADDDIVRRAGDHLERAVDRVLDEERQLPELTRVTVTDCDLDGEIPHEHVEVPCDICDEYVAVGPGIDGWETQSNRAHQSDRFVSTSAPTCSVSLARPRGNERTMTICTSGVVFALGWTIWLSLQVTPFGSRILRGGTKASGTTYSRHCSD